MSQKEYRTITQIKGPLVFVEKTDPVGYGELVDMTLPDGSRRRGQVLDSSDDQVVVQVFEGTDGIDNDRTSVKFLGETIQFGVSKDILGRVFDGAGFRLSRGEKLESSGAQFLDQAFFRKRHLRRHPS